VALAHRGVVVEDDRVDDEETLFRSVSDEATAPHWARDVDGVLRVSAAAFFDPGFKPSVDRAKLCNNDPTWTRRAERDGVAKLSAQAIRSIDPDEVADRDSKQHVLQRRSVDVVPDRREANATTGERENPAHALVVTTPQIAKDNSSWRRVRIALARVATDGGWALEPASARAQ